MASWELARRQQRTASFVPLLLSSASSCETLPFDDRTLRSIFSYRGRVEDMGRQIHARYRDRPMRCAGHFFGGPADRGLRFCSWPNSEICRGQVRHHQRRLKQPIFSRRPQGTRTRYPLQDWMRRVAAPGLEDARERPTASLNTTTPAYRNYSALNCFVGSGISKVCLAIFTASLLPPRDEAMRIFPESDVTVLTDPTMDRQYPFPINGKIEEYWDDVWQQTNAN
jgi:hypothetical protein